MEVMGLPFIPTFICLLLPDVYMYGGLRDEAGPKL